MPESQATMRAAIREEISTITRRAELIPGLLAPFDIEWEPEFNQPTLESMYRHLHEVSGALGLILDALTPDDLISQVVQVYPAHEEADESPTPFRDDLDS